jgi:uridine kinase
MIEKRVKNDVKIVGPNEIDIDTLNKHISSLLKGEEVVTPIINVKANSRKMRTVNGKNIAAIIVEGVYCDKVKHLDMVIYFDIDFEQLREQRSKKEDVSLYPKGDNVRTLLENISRTENKYIKGTKVPEEADLKLNSKYEILYRIPFRDDALI